MAASIGFLEVRILIFRIAIKLSYFTFDFIGFSADCIGLEKAFVSDSRVFYVSVPCLNIAINLIRMYTGGIQHFHRQ